MKEKRCRDVVARDSKLKNLVVVQNSSKSGCKTYVTGVPVLSERVFHDDLSISNDGEVVVGCHRPHHSSLKVWEAHIRFKTTIQKETHRGKRVAALRAMANMVMQVRSFCLSLNCEQFRTRAERHLQFQWVGNNQWVNVFALRRHYNLFSEK